MYLHGLNKHYIHIDEAYSFGLASYNKTEIEDNEDFYNTWHTKEYYKDYLSVNKDEIASYKQVYENQKNDVHPPLYYLLLRFAMGFSIDNFSKWTGIILNIIIYCFITVFMYLILKQLFEGEKREKEKALILAFLSSITLASVSNVIYIRMYSLLTLEILITIFLHIKLLKNQKPNTKLLLALSLTTLAGILTHYYYIFYIAIMYLIFFIKYIKEKNIKALVKYTITMLISGVASLIIFPYSIKHMFFEYRGQGVISNFENIYKSILNILEQLRNLNYYGFNNLLFFIIIVIVGLFIYKKIAYYHRQKLSNCSKESSEYKQNDCSSKSSDYSQKATNCSQKTSDSNQKSCYTKQNNKAFQKNMLSKENKEILKLIYIPSIFFFIIASIASPWNVLRYIVPVCGLIFVFLMFLLYKLINDVTTKKISSILYVIFICLILASPLIFKMQPELLYYDEKETIETIKNKANIPAVYLYNKQTSNFLDNIMIFSIIENSYITKDVEYTMENIQKILNNIDTSNGILIFINEVQKEDILNVIKNSKNFKNCEYINKLNATEVYYIN